MKTVRLVRSETSDQGTFGILSVEGLKFFTGELPWRDNDNDKSCIPAGRYQCRFTFSNRFQRKLYLIGPVESRAGIRIHPANRMGDSKLGYISEMHGCIALGEKLGWIGKQKAVLISLPAVRRFEKYMNYETFILEVIDV
jgi:hypothetical protein